MSNSIQLWFKSYVGLTLSLIFSLSSFTLLSAENEEEAVAEEIVVTGSRIKRASNISSPTPMVTLGEDQIENTGSVNVYDILN